MELFDGRGIPIRHAEDIRYDNTFSGLTAEQVQDAIDEIISTLPERAQDAVGGILSDTSEINFTYTDEPVASITASLIDNSIAYARLVDETALSVLGRASNSSGVTAAITAGSDGQVLLRNSSALAFTSLTAPSAGFTISNGLVFALADDLSALEGLSSSGFATRTASNTWAQRTMTGTVNRLSITDGDGVGGNPTFDISTNYAGQTTITTLGTITTGVWNGSIIGAAFIDQTADYTWTGTHFFSPADGSTYFNISPVTVAALPAGLSAAVIKTEAGVECLREDNVPFFVGVRIQGTYDSPTAATSGINLFVIQGRSYDGTAIGNAGNYSILTNEAWTATAHGSRANVSLCLNGSTTPTEHTRFASGASFALQVPSGTTALPGLAFLNDTDSGWARTASNEITQVHGGAAILTTNANSQFINLTPSEASGITSLTNSAFSLYADRAVIVPSIGTDSIVRQVRINGSYASPTALLSGQGIGRYSSWAYNSSAVVQGGEFVFQATEDWGTGANGTELLLRTVTTATTSLTTRMTLGGNSTGSYARGEAGAAAQPYWSYRLDTDTGLYSSAADTIGVSCGGTLRAHFSTTAFHAVTDNYEIQLGTGTAGVGDLRLFHDGTNSVIRNDTGALKVQQGATEVARFDTDATAGNTRFLVYDVDNGTLERVSVGAADSGGTGFKVLRIPN